MKPLLLSRPNRPSLEICTTGRGRPLVFLGGLLNPEAIWHKQIPALASRRGLVVINAPGCGNSGIDRENTSLDTIVQDIVEALDSLLISNPVDVVGFSFGGMLGQLLAIQYPERVSSLVLINSCARHRDRPDDAAALRGEVMACPEVIDINGNIDLSLAGVYRTASSKVDLRSQLRRLNQPVMVLSAEKDGYMRDGEAEELADSLSNCRRVIVRDAGHFSLLTHADQVNAAILEFLSAYHGLPGHG